MKSAIERIAFSPCSLSEAGDEHAGLSGIARAGRSRLGRVATVSLTLLLAACASTTSTTPPSSTASTATATSSANAASTSTATDAAVAQPTPQGTDTLPEGQRTPPPQPGPRRDVHFPAIARSNLSNGLELDVVEYHTLPVVQLRLVVKSAGSARDPRELPGLASFVGDMLKEGTRAHTSAQIADAMEFLGGTLEVTTTQDTTTIACAVLKEHAETALGLINEIVSDPAFPQAEIDKLKRREGDRLTRSLQDPSWLSAREFYAAVFGGDHPYGHFDSTRESLRRMTRDDMVRFHRTNFVAGSMFLAVVGDVRPAEFRTVAEHALGRVRRGTAPPVSVPAPPHRSERSVVIVDRADSAQSLIRIGNIAVNRASPEYIPLAVANQVLGGEASSRLFMDLRERRSLTYGAYSRIAGLVASGTFQASGAVRTPVTGAALDGFFEHLARITTEPAADAEITESEAFLIDSFSLAVETPADLARLLVDLRTYGLPDDYWDRFRTQISSVNATQALDAARQHIDVAHNVTVIVGQASAFEHDAQHVGAVRVVDLVGHTVRELPYAPASAPHDAGAATTSDAATTP